MSEAQTTQAEQQQPQEPILKFALPLSIVNVILEGISELPLKKAMAAMEIVQRQAQTNMALLREQAQNTAAAVNPPAAPASPEVPPAGDAPAMKAVARKRPARAR